VVVGGGEAHIADISGFETAYSSGDLEVVGPPRRRRGQRDAEHVEGAVIGQW